MSLRDVDAWIGKTLFVPPIVWICQRTHQSQYAVSRLFWFVAAMDGFYRADTLFSSVLFGLMSLVMMFTAALRADSPTFTSHWFRMLSVFLLGLDVLGGVTRGDWAGVEFWIFVLIAEYAATIRTIPPVETKSKVRVSAAERT